MNSRLALITFLDGGSGNVPDNSLPGIPGYPSQGLPVYPSTGPVYPGGPVDPGYGQGLPPINYPGQGLPHPPHYPAHPIVFPPVGPDNTLPPSETPNPPVISLPIVLPPVISPTPPKPVRKFELKYSVVYGWVLVPVDSDSIDNTLPATPEPK